MLKFLAGLPRRQKQALMVLCDVVILPFSFWAAQALRLSTWDPHIPYLFLLSAVIPLIAIPIFIQLGLYRTVIRYADDKLLATAMYGISLTVLVLILIVVMSGIVGVPRSSFVIFWLLAITFVVSSRHLVRKLIQRFERRQLVEKRQKIAIYGAGKAGVQLAMALRSSPEYQVLAFFDDQRDLQGTTVFGVRVYPPPRAEKVIKNYGLAGMILAIPSATRTRRREIVENFEEFGLVLKTLPGMADLVGGQIRVEDLREIGIEDLLGRDPVPPTPDLLALCITEKCVMVSGAGGSIGSELCRQILRLNPFKIILYDVSEFALYKIDQELRQFGSPVQIEAVLGDVKDRPLLEQIMREHHVQTVYHAAAYKHVPLVEHNICVGIENNVIGTLTCALAAIEVGLETFVLISTDKAVRPTNVMGASKRLAEMILQALAKKHGSRPTRFCMVRFGNVLGSSGSVVPLFKDQIRRGGPITVTHSEVMRYFMTIPEAAQLVLQAGSMGEGGDVFVLDMGEPVKIVDLAYKMVQLTGLTIRDEKNPDGEIEIRITGLRVGEKLYEELLIGDDVVRTSHSRILRAQEDFLDWNVLESGLTDLMRACRDLKPVEARQILRQFVVDYDPQAQVNQGRIIEKESLDPSRRWTD